MVEFEHVKCLPGMHTFFPLITLGVKAILNRKKNRSQFHTKKIHCKDVHFTDNTIKRSILRINSKITSLVVLFKRHTNFTHCSGVAVVDFEQVYAGWLGIAFSIVIRKPLED